MSRWVLVDDTDSGIQYTGSWFQDQGSQNSLGNFGIPYQSTLHGTNSNGGFSYSFEGTKVLITGTVQYPVASGSTTSNPSWVCSVDGATIPSNTYSIAENRLDLCETDTLSDGTHTITVQVTSSNQHTFWFDYIQYFPSSSTNLDSASLSIDSTDSQIDYGSGWEEHSPGQITSQTGSSVLFSFEGVSLTWIGFYDNTLSLAPTTATYSVDGQKLIAFNLNGAAAQATGIQYNQILFQTSQLSPGNHTIKVVYQGNSQTAPLSISILIVQGGPSTNSTASASGTSSSVSPGPSSAPVLSSSGSPHPTASTSGLSKKAEAVIGEALGGLALLVALFVAFLLWRRRKRSNVRKHTYIVVDPCDPPPMITVPGPIESPSSHFRVNDNGRSRSAPPLAEPTSPTATASTNSYSGYVSVSESPNHAASPGAISTTTTDIPPSPGNGKNLEAERRYVVANTFTPICLEPPARLYHMDFSHPEVVRDEDSGFRFLQTDEGQQVQVLPPDYTPV